MTIKLQKSATKPNIMLYMKDYLRAMENNISHIFDVLFSEYIGITADTLASAYEFTNARPAPTDSFKNTSAFKDEVCFSDALDNWIEMEMNDIDEDEWLASLFEEHRLYSSRSDQL